MKDKILNFLLFFSIFLLIFSFFSKPEQKNLTGDIILSSTSSAFTVPNLPSFYVENGSNEEFSFNSCEDLKVLKSWKIHNVESKKCDELTVLSWQKVVFFHWEDYKDYSDFWNYSLKLEKQDLELTTTFEIENKGFFNKLFSTIIYAPIYNTIVYFLNITGELGFAIIIITIILRLILLIPQHKMMVSQKKMQAIQPKIKEMQEKYKNDKQKLWMELMELYKKEWVNPAGSCLPLLIQMPLLLAVYYIIRWIQDKWNSFYLYSPLENINIFPIKADFFGINLLEITNTLWAIWIALAFSIWLLQFLQLKASFAYNKMWTGAKKDGVVLEKKKGEKDYSDPSSFMPDPEIMSKVMLYALPFMIFAFSLFFEAGVALYWWTSTLFIMIQQLVVNFFTKK